MLSIGEDMMAMKYSVVGSVESVCISSRPYLDTTASCYGFVNRLEILLAAAYFLHAINMSQHLPSTIDSCVCGWKAKEFLRVGIAFFCRMVVPFKR